MDKPTKTVRPPIGQSLAAASAGFSRMPRQGQNAAFAETRSMPESIAAEAAVLGSMVLDPQCINEVAQEIGAEAFYRVENQRIFSAIIALYEKGVAFDLVLLRDELAKRNDLADIGGVEYLRKIAQSVPSAANVVYYLGIVKDKFLLRQLIQSASDILTEAFSETGEPAAKLDEAEKKIFAVSQQKITGSAVPLKSLLTQAFENIEGRAASHITGLPTGFRELDELTCGLQNSEVIIVAGRPSMGKTSLALNIAEHIGADNDMPVAVFSLEMSKQQLAERMLCSRGGVDTQLVRKGMLSTEQLKELITAGSELSEKPIYIDDTAGLTPLELRAKARRLKSQYDIRCVVIDYLQLMTLGTARVESRQQEISQISRYIKALARELDMPVIALSQLNRSPEGRENHRPRMSDLRESGSLEQDADVVILLHREDYYHQGDNEYTNSNTAEIIIAKQRNGPTGSVDLTFDEKFTRFENLSMAQEPF